MEFQYVTACMDEYRCCFGFILTSNESFWPFHLPGQLADKKKKRQKGADSGFHLFIIILPLTHRELSVCVCEWSSIRALQGGK